MSNVAVLFDVGRVLASREARRLLRAMRVKPADLIARHVSGDWGALMSSAEKSNFAAVTCKHAPIRSVFTYTFDGVDYAFSVETNTQHTATEIRVAARVKEPA